MPSLRDCIAKVGKRLSPADAEAMHARAKQYLADGHPVEKAEKMAVDFSIGEAEKQIDSIYKQAGVKRPASTGERITSTPPSPVSSRADAAPPATKTGEQGSGKETVVKKTKKGKRIGVGLPASGEPDILNMVEEFGGVKSRTQIKNPSGVYDNQGAIFSGPARRLLRSEGGESPDDMAKMLHQEGYLKDGHPNTFLEAVEQAVNTRKKEKTQYARKGYEDRFENAFLGNGHARKWLRAGQPITVDDLNVGDKFEVEGEEFEVKAINDDGNVTIKDGITKTLPPGTEVYPDKGKVEKAKQDTEFLPEEPKEAPKPVEPVAPVEPPKRTLESIKAERAAKGLGEKPADAKPAPAKESEPGAAVEPVLITKENAKEADKADTIFGVSAANKQYTLWYAQRKSDGKLGHWYYISTLGKTKAEAHERAMETARRIGRGDMAGIAFQGTEKFVEPKGIAVLADEVGADMLQGRDLTAAAEKPIGFGKNANVLLKDIWQTDPGWARWAAENLTGRRDWVANYIKSLPEYIIEQQQVEAQVESAMSPENTAILKRFDIIPTQEGNYIALTGKTYDWKQTIKQFGGRWQNDHWTVPVSKYAEFVATLKDAAKNVKAGEAVPGYVSDPRLKKMREDARALPDQSKFTAAEPLTNFVQPDTAALLARGEKVGMEKFVVDEQIEDVARINRAYQKGKRLFVLASEPGSGKTFVLGGAIRELRRSGAKKIVYITLRKELITQIKDDLAPYDIGDVEFYTYTQLRGTATTPGIKVEPTDALIWDEAHAIKNVGDEENKVQQAEIAKEWLAKAKFTVLSTATPFEDPTQAAYLEPTGVFEPVFGTAKDFALAHGAKAYTIKDSRGNILREGLRWMRGPTADADAKEARDFLQKQGVFTSRRIRLPKAMVDSRLVKMNVSQEAKTLYDDFAKAAAEHDEELVGLVKAQIVNLQKRFLEAAKVERGIQEADSALKRGRYPIIFVETKAERIIDINALIEREDEYQIAVNQAVTMGDRPPSRKDFGLPFEAQMKVYRSYLRNTGKSVIQIPSAEDVIAEHFGPENTAIFTGSVTPKVAQANLDRWRASKKPMVIVATMAKGGTGLSLHDKKGNHPTTQININLPWSATQVVQVAQRSARYGIQSKAEMQWIFADNLAFDKILAERVGGRMATMGALVQGEKLAGADNIENWNFEDASFADTSKQPPPSNDPFSLTEEEAVTEDADGAILERTQDEINDWQKANPKAPKIEVVYRPDWMENGRGVKGQYRGDGILVVNAAYADKPTEVANHEWAHDTLSSNEGRMAIATFATRELPATDLSDLARKYPKQSGESTVDHRIRLAEEWVAKNAEKSPGVWQRIVESIKAWLQRHGMTTLTNEEAARALLRALRVNLPSGPRGGARSSVGERTDTPAFRQWFGGSKVVDENGKPKVVYHGTGSEFDAFDTSLEGAHFGTEEQAHRRLGNKSFEPGAKNTRNGRLVAAYLSIKNPLRVPDLGTWKFGGVVRELRFDGVINAAEADRAYEEFNKADDAGWNELKQILKGKGYDGFVYENQQEGEGDSYVAFYPTQIKSATGNRGTFDPNNPDIRYSVGDEGPSFGIKNAAVEQQRSDWNLPPPKERHGMAYEEARAEAKARFDADPFVGQKLVEELSANPRAPTGVENLILDHELVRLHNERNAAEKQFGDAAKSKDDAQMALAEARINAARDAFERTMDVADAVGTKSSESLYLRKAMLKEDYSLAALERKMKQANGGEDLTKAQEEEVRKIHEKYQATLKTLEAKLTQVETERAKAVLDVELLKIIKGVAAEPKAQRNREADDKYFETQAAAAEKRLAGKKAFDPADLNSYAIYAANLLHKKQPKTMAKSALTDETISSYPPEFEQEMIAKFGESVRPHLKEIYQRALVATPLIESQVPGTRNVKGERKTTKEKIKDRIEEGDNVEDLGIYVQKLAEQFVREGITEREALVTAVHKELNGLGLEISRRDTMDAISGYGKFKPLDQDEVKATLRDLKGQMQQVGKLEDMAAGQAPAKTGVERRTPTDEERRLIQQVEEAKRKGGFNVTDPVKQLKTALDAIKTRLKNSIADLDFQIAAGKQTVKEKTGTPYDAEATALRERRDELKKQYDQMFGKSELTDAQKLELAEKAADRQIAELERQLRTNELFAKEKAQPLNSPALEAKRARIAALKEERKYARQLIQLRADPKTRDEIALQAYKTATAKRIAELQERLARGDFAPRAKPPERVLDTEALRLKALHEKVKTEFHEALIHERMKRRTTSQKVFDTAKEIINLPRVIMSSGDVSAVLRQGGFIAFGNPKRAAQSIGPMFKALGSEQQSSIIEQEILNRPNAARYKQHKLYIAPHNVLTLAAMEEQIMSRLAKYIPGVKASNRAYITFLNKLRADSFDAMYEAMTPEQQKNPKNVDAIASFINVATGRGNLGKASGMAENLATVFFSPRLLASRFQLLAGTPAMRGDKETRKMIRKEYVKFVTGLAVILGLGAMAGADIEKDPRSTDFLKLRFGNTRLDVLGGLGQVTTLVTRLLSGETKNAKGEIKPIRGNVDYGATDSIKVMTNFIRSKLSPSIGAAVNIARGETMTGQEVTPTNQTMSLAMPLSFQDIGEAFQAQGPAAGTALAALSLFGFGLQQYGADIEGIPSDLRRSLNDAGLSAPNPDRPQVGPSNKKRWASDAEYARYQKEVSDRFTTLMTGRKAMLEKMPKDKAQELVTKMMEISRKSAHDRLDRYAR